MNFRLVVYQYRFLAYAIIVVGMTMLLTCMLMMHSVKGSTVTQSTTTPVQYSGEAEQISNYLFQGQYIPGFSPQSTPVPTQTVQPPSAGLINKAKVYLINNLEQPGTTIALDSLTVQAITKIVWLDNQLGCAYPGEVTIPDNVPGWIIVIKYNNKYYVFHTDDGGSRLRLCQVMDAWVN